MTALLTQALTEAQGYMADVTGLAWGFGRLEDARRAAPPRIVWVPQQAPSYGTPQAVGGHQRALYKRTVRVEAHVWGATYEQAEQLVYRLAQALRKTALTSYHPLGESWTTEAPAAAQRDLGAYVVVLFDIDLVITDAPLAVAQVQTVAFDPSGSAPGDGELDAGET